MASNTFKKHGSMLRYVPKDQRTSHPGRQVDSMRKSHKQPPLFQVGRRQIYLPKFTITFLRTPTLSPYYAHFNVPLWFNKFDLRDYLLHAYSVRTHNVRSFIIQQAIQSVTKGSWRDISGKRKLYRPKAKKKMIVELEKPFVWPDPPKEMDDWEPERYERARNAAWEGRHGDLSESETKNKRRSIVEQVAQKLLNGEERWKGMNPTVAGGAGGRLMQSPLG